MIIKFIKILLGSGLLLLAASVWANQQETVYTVLEIEDGDTLILDIGGNAERVQLLGIDAPESTRNAKFNLDLQKTGLSEQDLISLGEASTLHLKSLVAVGDEVKLQADIQNRDKYGRIPAIMKSSSGRPVAEDMVLDGYAVPLPDASMDRAYVTRMDRLERFSRKKGNGLWSSHADIMHDWYDRTR